MVTLSGRYDRQIDVLGLPQPMLHRRRFHRCWEMQWRSSRFGTAVGCGIRSAPLSDALLLGGGAHWTLRLCPARDEEAPSAARSQRLRIQTTSRVENGLRREVREGWTAGQGSTNVLTDLAGGAGAPYGGQWQASFEGCGQADQRGGWPLPLETAASDRSADRARSRARHGRGDLHFRTGSGVSFQPGCP